MLLILTANIIHIRKSLSSTSVCTTRLTKQNSPSKCMHAGRLHMARRYSIRKCRHSGKAVCSFSWESPTLLDLYLLVFWGRTDTMTARTVHRVRSTNQTHNLKKN